MSRVKFYAIVGENTFMSFIDFIEVLQETVTLSVTLPWLTDRGEK